VSSKKVETAELTSYVEFSREKSKKSCILSLAGTGLSLAGFASGFFSGGVGSLVTSSVLGAAGYVWDWAGQLRTVDSGTTNTGLARCRPEFIVDQGAHRVRRNRARRLPARHGPRHGR